MAYSYIAVIRKLAIAVGLVFAPIEAKLGATLALVVLDFGLGLWAAKKAGTPITSNRMRDTVGKLLGYELAIAVGFIAEHYLTGDKLPIADIANTYVALTECTSCLENLNVITGKDLLGTIITKLNSLK